MVTAEQLQSYNSTHGEGEVQRVYCTCTCCQYRVFGLEKPGSLLEMKSLVSGRGRDSFHAVGDIQDSAHLVMIQTSAQSMLWSISL